MDLRRKIARLRDAQPTPPSVEAPAEPAAPLIVPDVVAAASDDLRARLRAVARRVRQGAPDAPASRARPSEIVWPFGEHTEGEHTAHRALRALSEDARHGQVRVRRALELSGGAAATLALDPSLASFDATRALFLDTETTGLSGGTGTLAFLIGMAWFEDGALRIEQLLLCDPGDERPMLCRVAERVARATALVTFNGRSFDLPLLRARFVMERVAPPPEPPHLDLLHVARRIYGSRVERCTLVTLERDVLGFARDGDIDGAEIPDRYRRFLVEGARDALLPVFEHNVWDLIALAALSGELGARLERTEAEGRFEASDLVGMARTTHRAGDAGRAVLLAGEAAALGHSRGEGTAAKAAHLLAATIHKRARDAELTRARLLDALMHSPDDARIHLELARCYERGLSDYASALRHAELAASAEPEGVSARRIARLRRKVGSAVQLKLPGM